MMIPGDDLKYSLLFTDMYLQMISARHLHVKRYKKYFIDRRFFFFKHAYK